MRHMLEEGTFCLNVGIAAFAATPVRTESGSTCFTSTYCSTVIPRLTSDPANKFFG